MNDTPARQVYRDLKTAFAVALEVWEGLPLEPTPEALQATAATAFIAMSRQQSSQPAGRAVPGSAPGRPAPSPAAATGPVPPCPKCQGEMWDERETKKNPKAPDFKCKNKTGCGEVIWPPRAKGGKPAAPAKAPDFNKVPEPIAAGIIEDETDLPF